MVDSVHLEDNVVQGSHNLQMVFLSTKSDISFAWDEKMWSHNAKFRTPHEADNRHDLILEYLRIYFFTFKIE